jgi:hypothetical protein
MSASHGRVETRARVVPSCGNCATSLKSAWFEFGASLPRAKYLRGIGNLRSGRVRLRLDRKAIYVLGVPRHRVSPRQ